MSTEDVWQLKIPIRLSLSSSEITSPTDVKPVYLLAPRHAYLPALAQQCLSFFQHVLLSLPGQNNSMPWFEYQGLPLNWTQPLGVLHDLLSPALAAAGAAAGADQQPGTTSWFSAPANPWCLTVHYQNMPASLQSHWQNAGAAKDHYFSSLKEAGYCCRGSDGCGAVMRLPGSTQDQLWSAANKGDGQAVNKVMNQLKLQPTQKPGSGPGSAPVRIYIRNHKQSNGGEDLLGVWENTYSSSRPIDLTQPDGSATLLAHVLNTVMPQRFPAPQPLTAASAAPGTEPSQQDTQQAQQPQHRQHEQPAVATAAGSTEAADEAADDPLGVKATASVEQQPTATAAGAEGQHSSAATTRQSAGAADGQKAGEEQQTAETLASPRTATSQPASSNHILPPGWPARGVGVFACGVQPDWCTPLGWLYTNLRAADGFLYIVVHIKQQV